MNRIRVMINKKDKKIFEQISNENNKMKFYIKIKINN